LTMTLMWALVVACPALNPAAAGRTLVSHRLAPPVMLNERVPPFEGGITPYTGRQYTGYNGVNPGGALQGRYSQMQSSSYNQPWHQGPYQGQYQQQYGFNQQRRDRQYTGYSQQGRYQQQYGFNQQRRGQQYGYSRQGPYQQSYSQYPLQYGRDQQYGSSYLGQQGDYNDYDDNYDDYQQQGYGGRRSSVREGVLSRMGRTVSGRVRGQQSSGYNQGPYQGQYQQQYGFNQQRRGQQYTGNMQQGRYQRQYGMNQQRRDQQYTGYNQGGGYGYQQQGWGGGSSVREGVLSQRGAGRWSAARGQQYGY